MTNERPIPGSEFLARAAALIVGEPFPSHEDAVKELQAAGIDAEELGKALRKLLQSRGATEPEDETHAPRWLGEGSNLVKFRSHQVPGEVGAIILSGDDGTHPATMRRVDVEQLIEQLQIALAWHDEYGVAVK